jgi:hypothetical protein
MTERCAVHPDRSSIGTCPRCGSYYCRACCKLLDGAPICASCLSIPGVDYLGELRNRYWGKRDGWVWFFGAFQSASLLAAMGRTAQLGIVWELPVQATSLGLAVAYFLLKPAARRWLFAVLPLSLLGSVIEILAGALPPDRKAYALGQASGALAVFAAFLAVAYRDPRNKLAFRIEVSSTELAVLHKRLSNATAVRSVVYGALSLFVPLLGAFSLGLGVTALRRVNPRGHPPIGGRSLAIIGIVLSCASIALWSTLMVVWLMRRR